MMKGPITAVLLALASSLVPLGAQTVAVALIESQAAQAVSLSSLSERVIAGALDALFDAGAIGSNDRPVQGDALSFQSYAPSADAAESYIDYIIVVYAEYGPDVESLPLPSCRYRLLRVRDGAELKNGSVTGAIPRSALSIDIEKACSAVGALIVNSCSEAWRVGPVSWRKHEHSKA